MLLIVSGTIWAGIMGYLTYTHYVLHVDPELGFFAPDITFERGKREYFSIFEADRKTGYKSEALLYYSNAFLYVEDTAVKLNLAGMSREVFIQCSASIDSVNLTTPFIDYSINSGSHSYHFRGMVRSDSLIIEVKTDVFEPWRKGVFIVDDDIIFPVTLPYILHHAKADTLFRQIFDPFTFSLGDMTAVRSGHETVMISGEPAEVTVYDVTFPYGSARYRLKDSGRPIDCEGDWLFSGELGAHRMEKAVDRNVFLLPMEVTLGRDFIYRFELETATAIDSPRTCNYLEVELKNIRAANLDFGASNKKYLSYNPVVIAIHNRPLLFDNRRASEPVRVAADTTIYSATDYIHPFDARMKRTASGIAGASTDTLAVAAALCRWVHDTMTYQEGLQIVRSTDILRERRGAADEYTKLFTALARSIRIPTQINLGLVYRDNAFRYHSWPSVFVDSVWHDLDPVFGQDNADATHITLVRGDFDRQVELIRLLGQFTIDILDYR